MRIASIVGARPQFMKAATVSRAISSGSGMTEVLIHTGQHYDNNMSDVFFSELEIACPDYRLGIGPGSHGSQTGQMLEAIEEVLLKEKADWLLVYGDTNSTLAGALAAAKLHIPVAHVEAGLRSFNRRMPEEINRVLTDHVSELLFAPTQAAVTNLKREGLSQDKTHLVGDVMYDAALYYGPIAEQKSNILVQLGFKPKGYIIATVHREENTDDTARLRAICEGLNEVAREIPVILPLHPRTRKRFEHLTLNTSHLTLIDPVGYLDMLMLEKNAQLIATDSGGVQKEAFFYRVPCVTLRDETEWVELVDLEWNQVLPPKSPEEIVDGIYHSLKRFGIEAKLYGEGLASKLIVQILREHKPIAI